MGLDTRSAVAVWRQTEIPVIVRRMDGTLLIKLPFATDNREWLRAGRRTKPEWPKWNRTYKSWEVPLRWFNALIRQAVQRFKRVYVVQPFRVKEQCAPACWNAKGFECKCSCMGKNHGSENPSGWHVVSETFAVQYQDREYACRLVVAADAGDQSSAPPRNESREERVARYRKIAEEISRGKRGTIDE
jgi:hypothetical protein